MLRRRNERHDVVQKGAARLHRLVDLDEMLVVDPRDHHRVDLAEDAALGEHLEPLQLPIGEDLRRLLAGDALVLPEDPRIDLGADFRIGHVDRYRHVIDVEGGDRVDVIGQRETVRRQAELDVGGGFGDQLEGLEGLGRIGQRIAGAGDAEHRHLRYGRGDREHFFGGLFRRQLLRDDAGPRLIGAIILAVAIVALDVAGGRHGDMHARIMVVRLLAVAGMVLDLLPDLGRHVLGPVARAAARLAAASGCCSAALVLCDLLHDVVERFGGDQVESV